MSKLTRSFKESILERAVRDSVFRLGLLQQSFNESILGNKKAAKELRDRYYQATNELEEQDKNV